MSPVSLGANGQSSSEESEIQSVEGFCEEVLAEFAALGDTADQLEVELLTSEVIGQWWENDDDLGPDLISFAAQQASPAAAGLLAALRVFALTEDQRAAAAEALVGLAAVGVEEPAWAATLGEVEAGECWTSGDVYGDQISLLCSFGEGEDAHGLLALIDFTDFDGWVKDVAIVESPHEVLADMRSSLEDGGDLVTVEQVEPSRARQLIEDGLFGTDQFAEPEVGEDFVRFRALAIARARMLPEGEAPAEPEELDDDERDEIVATFLEEAADEIEDTEATRACARLLVDFGCDREPSRPLRTGPEKIAAFLDSLLDSEIEVDEDFEESLPSVLLAWAGWAAARDGLPETAVTALREVVEEFLEEFTQEESLIDAYLDGDEEFSDPAELTDLLDRRMFAVPAVDTRIGEDDVDLDPGDPEQRGLLVLGEHPEYHDAVADDDLDDESRTHLAIKTAVVDQLWDNDPPEVWQAVRRLQEKGLERAEIFEEVGRVFGEQLQPATGDEIEFDLDGYRKSLSEIA